jgi:hypothetical protein
MAVPPVTKPLRAILQRQPRHTHALDGRNVANVPAEDSSWVSAAGLLQGAQFEWRLRTGASAAPSPSPTRR